MASSAQLIFSFPKGAFGTEAELERHLTLGTGERVALHVTNNSRTMISSKRSDCVLHVRVHRMFLEADARTTQALARYLLRPRDKHASATLSQFIETHRSAIGPASRKAPLTTTVGKHHDLSQIFVALNEEHFSSSVDATITWGQRPVQRRRQRRTIKLGSYSHESALIRIHPALDQAFVPGFFVAYIVFHEMLHHVVEAKVTNGRHIYHSAEFRARERAFPHYDRAIAWERQHVAALMRAGNW